MDVELPGVVCGICGNKVTVPSVPIRNSFWWRPPEPDPRDIRRLEITMPGANGRLETSEVFVCKDCMRAIVDKSMDGSSLVSALLTVQAERILAFADERSDDEWPT